MRRYDLAAAALAALLAGCGGDAPAGRGAAADTAATGEPAALRALADSLLPTLERLSGLAVTGPVRIEQRSVAQVREYVEAQLAEELPPAALDGVQSTYALLGLIPDTLDLGALLLDLYTEQIVGYYDPESKTLYAVEGVPPEQLRPVVAHELVHALQDQHADLDSLISRERGNDRQLAAQAAIEGHAMLVMFALLTSEAAGDAVDPATVPNPADQLRAAMESPGAGLPVFRRAPRAMREMLLFPYVAGASFVQAYWRTGLDDDRAPPLGDALPQSTEQVLWPIDRFIEDRDAPTEIRFDDDAGGWQTLYENTLGAFETRLFLDHHLQVDTLHARGWDGDRFRLLQDADSARALVWYSIWDDQTAAGAFVAQLRRIVDAGGLSADIRTDALDGRPVVRVVIAPRGAALPTVSAPRLCDECGS